jgi:hypothetical protein
MPDKTGTAAWVKTKNGATGSGRNQTVDCKCTKIQKKRIFIMVNLAFGHRIDE